MRRCGRPVRSIRKSTPPPSIAIGGSVRLMTRIAPPHVVAPTEQRSRLDVLVEVEQVVRVVAPLCLQQPRVVAAVVLHHSRLVIPGREVDIAIGLRVRRDRGVVLLDPGGVRPVVGRIWPQPAMTVAKAALRCPNAVASGATSWQAPLIG